MFESIEMAPPDPILGLTEAFKSDPNPAKINLGVGVYKDANGNTPVLESVKKAEEKLLTSETTKNYMPIDGSPEFGAVVQGLLFGAGHEIINSRRAVTAHAPGGTGALRVAGNFIKQQFPNASVWLSEPTWANHPNIFRHAGLELKTYPYFDPNTNGLHFDNFIDGLKCVPAGDVVLLHGCCHNPSGVDPIHQQWAEIADVAAAAGFLPLVDFAYQGFADGLEEDATGLRRLCRPDCELMICSSFSKNFGLYNERVGALTIVAASADAAKATQSQVKAGVRANYSNPPAHGGLAVTTVLTDTQLRALWEQEVTAMRERINGMRRLFVDTLAAKGANRDFSFITGQRGMFSFSGLTREQVQTLRDQHSIYIVGSGRINIAGMTEQNMATLCEAIVGVL